MAIGMISPILKDFQVTIMAVAQTNQHRTDSTKYIIIFYDIVNGMF